MTRTYRIWAVTQRLGVLLRNATSERHIAWYAYSDRNLKFFSICCEVVRIHSGDVERDLVGNADSKEAPRLKHGPVLLYIRCKAALYAY